MAPLVSIQHFQLGSGDGQVTVTVGGGVVLNAARGKCRQLERAQVVSLPRSFYFCQARLALSSSRGSMSMIGRILQGTFSSTRCRGEQPTSCGPQILWTLSRQVASLGALPCITTEPSLLLNIPYSGASCFKGSEHLHVSEHLHD